MSTATEMMQRQNLRRRRTDELVSAVIKELRGRIDDPDVEREVREAMYSVFSAEGVEVLTDYTRAQIGLPPRIGDGWTTEEIVALERYRLEALSKPMTVTIPDWEAIQRQKRGS